METPMIDLYRGDCLTTLRNLPDNSVDSIVTDPPYGLSNTDPAKVQKALTAWVMGARDYVPEGKGFMGQKWDEFVPPPAVWDECFRVLKPGGHMAVFAGSRTQDLMGMSIRLAGFDLRDSVAWLYATGFPKSLDVSKQIDKAGGVSPVEQARILMEARKRRDMTRAEVAKEIGCTESSVRDWEEGRSRAKGQEPEFIIPSTNYRGKLAALLEYTADERRKTGVTTDRRGDGTTYALGHSGTEWGSTPSTPEAKKWEGWGTALKPGHEPIILARKPFPGTVAANVQEHGTGALNIDATRIGMSQEDAEFIRKKARPNTAGHEHIGGVMNRPATPTVNVHAAGRWPANVILDEDQAAALDEQSGPVGSNSGTPTKSDGTRNSGGMYSPGTTGTAQSWEKRGGGASRFFYVAKAGKKERPSYVDENGDTVSHPTVKPVALIRWLVRLITPPGGTVLEPFAGTGTTGEAAALEGFACIMIERHEPYLPLIRARMDAMVERIK